MTPLFRKFLSMNWLMILFIGGLLTFGVYSIYSAGFGGDQEFSGKWNEQVRWIIIGATIFFGIALFDYKWIRFVALPAWVIAIVLLMLTNVKMGGATSWLKIGGIQFQPSQAAIFSTILMLATILGDLPKLHKFFAFPVVKIGLCGFVCVVPLYLIMDEPDIGSAAVICTVLALMLTGGGIPFRYLISMALVVITVIPILYFFGMKPYQKERIDTWVKILNNQKVDTRNEGYSITNNMTAIGSAGFDGKGFNGERAEGVRTIKELGLIPRNVAINDFIFTVIAEEHGFRGAATLIIAFGLLLLQLLLIAYGSRDLFGRLLVIGLAAQIFFHAFMNMGMCIGAVPITGLPLPLISYGGTFVVILLTLFGITQSVWVHRHEGLEQPAEEPDDIGHFSSPYAA
ncbi:MAG: rod shape determining protein RodA [Verrucomicrobiales bacterium]|jgi:rod shape determining protein RodA